MKLPVLYGTGGSPVGSWVQTIAVKAPNGASMSVSGGGETLTATADGDYYAFSVHNKSTQYTINVTMPASVGGASAPAQTVTTGTADGVITFKEFKFATITTSVTDAFEGVAVTCVSGGTTLTITPAVGTTSITFRVPSTGNWVISGVVSGDTYYASPNPVVISDLDDSTTATLLTRPDGKTVTPTDSIPLWLQCGGVNESYTTLDEVLADHDTLAILMTDHNAVDYMVRSTTWATDMCADATAMRYIGRRNYCADECLDDSDWCAAIFDSDYMSSVLTDITPLMTDDNTPSGYQASAVSNNENAYLAFNNDAGTTGWAATTQGGSQSSPQTGWLKLKFPSNVKVVGVAHSGRTNPTYPQHFVSVIMEGSTDDSVYDRLFESNDLPQATTKCLFNRYSAYQYYKFTYQSWNELVSANTPQVNEIRFLARTDVDETKIAIYGAASDSDIYEMVGGSPVTVGSTDVNGYGEISRTDLPNGTHTLYSSRAKDPSNLSNDFSRQFPVDSNTIEIFLMPEDGDKMLYWYGYKGNNLEICNTANGWTPSSGYSFIDATFSTIYINHASQTNKICYVGTKNKINASKINTIYECVSGINYLGLVREYATKSVAVEIASLEMNASTPTYYQTSYSVSDNYIALGTQNDRLGRAYALWYE